MDTVFAAKHFFNVDLPVLSSLLKQRFREASRRLHPDVGGDEEQFKRMKAAYEGILKSGLTVESQDQTERLVDGTPLSQLGLGLGPNTNGRDCEDCGAKGYRKHQDMKFVNCKTCLGVGVLQPCRACSTTGRFTLRNGNKVSCRRCNAKGFIIRSDLRRPFMGWTPWDIQFTGLSICPHCLGSGTAGEQTGKVLYYRCGGCNGTGEIKIYNPVILKGAMTQAQRKRQK